jgi:hypothetical protein
MAFALAIGLVGIAAYFASNTAFELAAGQAMLAIYQGSASNVYYVLNAIALLLISTVMLRSNIFSKVTAYWGILAGVLMLVPSTAGTIGIAFAFASLVPWAIFSVLIARRLFRLGSDALKEQA